MFKKSSLTEILESLDFEDWLDSEGITHKLTRGTNGIQANIRECPSCGNSKWKVYFGLETGRGNCFVCGEKFDKWKFISKHLGTSSSETYQHILGHVDSASWRPAKSRVQHSQVAGSPTLPTMYCFPINGRNIKYLQERGIGLDAACKFELGYCHSGGFDFVAPDGKPAFQDYSRRVIIPIRDLEGKIVSFQGRDITGLSDKKYLFPPGFSATGSVVYNANKIKGAKRIVMGEGVFDCIAIDMACAGDETLNQFGACASFGKKLSFQQIEVLASMARDHGLEEVIIMWDAEPEAIEEAIRAGIELGRRGIQVKLAILPDDKDPNEVPPEVVREAIFKSKPVTRALAPLLLLQAKRMKKVTA